MSDYVQLNYTNDLPSFLLNPDVNNTANVTQNRCCGLKVVAIPCASWICVPTKTKDMPLKWSADIHNHIKSVTFCESDSHHTNKNKLLQQMICVSSQFHKKNV